MPNGDIAVLPSNCDVPLAQVRRRSLLCQWSRASPTVRSMRAQYRRRSLKSSVLFTLPSARSKIASPSVVGLGKRSTTPSFAPKQASDVSACSVCPPQALATAVATEDGPTSAFLLELEQGTCLNLRLEGEATASPIVCVHICVCVCACACGGRAAAVMGASLCSVRPSSRLVRDLCARAVLSLCARATVHAP